jgi:ATP-binding cassette subfamily B protein
MRSSFSSYRQHDSMDCGPACLKMIARHFGRDYTLSFLRELCSLSHSGVSIKGISEAAEKIGLHTIGVSISFEQLTSEVPLPCIAHWNQKHFIVIYKITNTLVYVADPAHGLIKYTYKEFKKYWLSHLTIVTEEGKTSRKLSDDGSVSNERSENGILLLVETTPAFFELDIHEMHKEKPKKGFIFLLRYLSPFKKLIVQLFIGMLLGSLLMLIFPFLTQAVVDFGINHRNINFIYIILAAQLMLFFSQTTVDFIRNWILLHISSRVNINLVSDFLIKLMKLPIAFFDTKMIGDILQRINDHSRIEQFLTSATLNVLFSIFSLLSFSIILAVYNLKIFAVFLVGSILYSMWVILFLKRRRDLDFKRFYRMRENQDSLIQLINGMQEIKLHNCEHEKRWEWERIQAKLYKISIGGLKLSQYQQAGSFFINQLKNIIITFLAAVAVIRGEITLGMMLSIQYIIGQLNSPIEQMIGFIQSAQDAKLSLERLSEIHEKNDEEPLSGEKIKELGTDKSIYISNVSFHYPGMQHEYVLNELSLQLPEGKTTAIVGMSGSGKTTLLKLLLNFYTPIRGDIKVGTFALDTISNKLWREKCGVVMQEGFIFSDTIVRNIALGVEKIDKTLLNKAIDMANIRDFIENLPLGLNTKVGSDGHGISAGQKQRLLIARAIYKNPEYIFFDEATNALDANNEKVIMQNLDEFFKGRTVVVVAHRLSTVKNADQIVVMDKGKIVEFGTHTGLTQIKGNYYYLVKNQLELGN